MSTRSSVLSMLRRCAVMAAAVAGVLLAVAPASADHGRRARYYGPHVAAYFPLPPIPVFLPAPPIRVIVGPPGYYAPYPSGYAYADGYYGDPRRHRHHRRHGHHHHDCDD